jgi:hypothetical protein
MRRFFASLFVSALFASCLSGYTVRQTIMERSFDDGFAERLVLLHDYHKSDDSISTEQSKALIETFAQIRAQDPSAELFLERPESNEITRNVQRYFASLAERNEKAVPVFSDVVLETLKKNSAILPSGMIRSFLSLQQHDIAYLLPVIKDMCVGLIALPGIGGKAQGQLLVALNNAFANVNGVRFLDQRLGVVSLAVALLVSVILVPLFFNTPFYDHIVQRTKDLDISLHHVFSYINVFLDETIERCDHAQLFFTVCPAHVRDEINAIKSACAVLKQDVASRMHELMYDGMYQVSIVDFLTNVTRYMYEKSTSVPVVASRYDKAVDQKTYMFDAYVQTTFADMYMELLKLLMQSSRTFSLYDAWLASEMIRSSAKTIIIVTGFAHAERLIPLLRQNGFETVYDSPVHLVNGMRVDALQPFFAAEQWSIPGMFDSWYSMFKFNTTVAQSSPQLVQSMYQSLSLVAAYIAGVQHYYDFVDIKPLDVRLYSLMLLPAEELKSLQRCCPYDQHHVLRTFWDIPLVEDFSLCA